MSDSAPMPGTFSPEHFDAFQNAIVTLTRSAAKKSKERENRGYLFPLTHTAGVWKQDDADLPDPSLIGHAKAFARVRKVSMVDLISMGALSGEMQQTVMLAFEDVNQLTTMDSDDLGLMDVVRASQSKREMARGVAVAGFIDPVLVATETEANAIGDERIIWVDDIHPDDLEAYLDIVMKTESEAAKALAPFPEPRVASQTDRPAGTITSFPQQNPPAPEGQGVQPPSVLGV